MASADVALPHVASQTDEPPAQPEQSAPEGAYNPETGEINWDCPCIAGMVKPPCGDSFKAAFSCFVYSEAEPKGYDCVDAFRAMQACFKEYPEIYGEEGSDDEDPIDKDDEGEADDRAAETAVRKA